MAAIIISADDIKKSLDDYDPNKSHLVHRQSTQLADKLFAKTVKSSEYDTIVLISGGSASGKTEFVSEYLADQQSIIFDGTLPSFEGARIKADLARRYHKRVLIKAIWPRDIKIAFAAFLERERKYPDEFFYKTHSSSRKALLEIAQSSLNIPIDVYENVFTGKTLAFEQILFEDNKKFIDFIESHQYTEEELLRLITKEND
ncbi:MAG: hypothetical protein Q7K33_01840 [Candidatus Berkelbacteria bacterium]|nr:hypothetical protein [Candidatus Berkelbacteria bacterium]